LKDWKKKQRKIKQKIRDWLQWSESESIVKLWFFSGMVLDTTVLNYKISSIHGIIEILTRCLQNNLKTLILRTFELCKR
jgi:hypothetical protein